MKNVLKVALINFTIVAAFFCGLEVVLRVVDVIPSTIVRPVYFSDLIGDYDPNMHVKNLLPASHPYVFTTNSQGYRSLQEFDKSNDAISVLCLGDSFTMGWGLEDSDTYTEQLGRILAKRYPENKFNIINSGKLFSNVLDQIDYYRAKGRLIRPKVVVFQYYYNDLGEMVAPYVSSQVVRNARMGLSTENRYVSKIFKNSAIYNFIAYLKYKFLFNKRLPDVTVDFLKTADNDLYRWLISDPTEGEKKCLREWDMALNEKYVGCLQKFWNNQRDAILQLKKEVETDGGVFILLAVPNMYQMEKYRNVHNSVFYAMKSGSGLNYIDMTRVFRRALYNVKDELFLEGDEHTNGYGDSLIAETLADSIRLTKEGNVSFVSDGYDNTYTNAVHISVYAAADKLGYINEDNGVERFEQTSNARIKFGGEGCGLAYLGVPGEQGGEAQLRIRIKTRKKIRYVDVISFRKVVHTLDGLSGVKLSINENGATSTLFEYFSNKGGQSDSAENIKISEAKLANATNEFELIYDFYAKGELQTENNPHCSPERRLEIYCYPEQ